MYGNTNPTDLDVNELAMVLVFGVIYIISKNTNKYLWSSSVLSLSQCLKEQTQ